jgi:hypothetical protein
MNSEFFWPTFPAEPPAAGSEIQDIIVILPVGAFDASRKMEHGYHVIAAVNIRRHLMLFILAKFLWARLQLALAGSLRKVHKKFAIVGFAFIIAHREGRTHSLQIVRWALPKSLTLYPIELGGP